MKFYISQNSQFFSEWRNFLTKRSFKRHNEKSPNEESPNEKSPKLKNRALSGPDSPHGAYRT